MSSSYLLQPAQTTWFRLEPQLAIEGHEDEMVYVFQGNNTTSMCHAEVLSFTTSNSLPVSHFQLLQSMIKAALQPGRSLFKAWYAMRLKLYPAPPVLVPTLEMLFCISLQSFACCCRALKKQSSHHFQWDLYCRSRQNLRCRQSH